MYLTTPPSVDNARLRSHAVVTFAIISGVETDSPVTTSSKTSSLKCLLTGVLSTSPHASTVLSFGLPLRRTMIPSSSENLGASRCGLAHRMSGNNDRNISLVSNSVFICRRNALAIGREYEKIPTVISGSFSISWIVRPKVIRTLSVLTTPKIKIAIWSRLHLATTREIAIAVEVGSPEHVNQQEEQIRLRQLPFQQTLDLWVAVLSRSQDRFVIRGYCQFPIVHFDACT